MKPLTVVSAYSPGILFEKTLLPLTKSGLIERIVIVNQEPIRFKMDRCHVLASDPLPSQKTLNLILDGIQTKYLLAFSWPQQISLEPKVLEKYLEVAESTKAGLVYSDFYDESDTDKDPSPVE